MKSIIQSCCKLRVPNPVIHSYQSVNTQQDTRCNQPSKLYMACISHGTTPLSGELTLNTAWIGEVEFFRGITPPMGWLDKPPERYAVSTKF